MTAMPFRIVCPDGIVRHLAYANRGDAEFDAKICDRKSCQLYAAEHGAEPAVPVCNATEGHRVEEFPDTNPAIAYYMTRECLCGHARGLHMHGYTTQADGVLKLTYLPCGCCNCITFIDAQERELFGSEHRLKQDSN